jgi:hypothetical protein
MSVLTGFGAVFIEFVLIAGFYLFEPLSRCALWRVSFL